VVSVARGKGKNAESITVPSVREPSRLESLSKPIVDSEGNITELGELIADDKVLDLDQWRDKATFLLGCPTRLVEIAQKKVKGQALTNKEHQYLWRFRQKEQKQLVMA